MEESDRIKQETEERIAELEARNLVLERNQTVSANVAKLIGLGYDEKLASKKANALADGDYEKVFECEEEYRQNFEKAIRADLLKSTPKPDDKGGKDTVTLDKLKGMTPQERFNFSKEHPDEYKKLYGGN